MSKEYVAASNALVPNGTVLLGQAPDGTLWPIPLTSGGTGVEIDGSAWTPSSKTALSNAASSVKSSAAGALGGWMLHNPSAATTYIQFFDVATAGAVTLGTTVPTFTFGLAAGASANVEFTNGIAFTNGMQVAATTTTTGNTAPATALVATFLYR